MFDIVKKEGPIQLTVSTAPGAREHSPLLKVSWDDAVNERMNFLEEDLFLRVRSEDGDYFLEKAVSHLRSTECHLPGKADLIHVELIRKRKPALTMVSSFYYTPTITLISENERRHHIYWQDIDWDALKDEVKAEAGIDWHDSVEVFLHIRRWPDDVAPLPLEEWVSPGLTDHQLIFGSLKQVSLEIWKKGKKGREKFLKEIFDLEITPSSQERRVVSTSFNYPGCSSFLMLKREVWEGDSIQLRAYWNIRDEDWSEIQDSLLEPSNLTWDHVFLSVRLKVREDGREWEWQPEEEREIIPGTTDWLFPGVPLGKTYKAVLEIREKGVGGLKVPLLESNLCSLPFDEDRITLMPVDESRIYAYWHVDKKGLMEKLSKIAHHDQGLKTYIKIYHDFAGKLHHHPDKDVEIHLDLHDNWYLSVEPDKVYRAEIIAVGPSGDVVSVTPISNPVQTMRTETGGLPIEYKEAPCKIEHPSMKPVRSRMDTARSSKGLLVLHLHAHLPFLRRRVIYGESGIWRPLGFPEEWYHEAVRETYVPLIMMMERLRDEGVDFRLSMDLSPTLTNMMRCPMLQEEFIRYMDAHISLARLEVERTRREAPQYHDTAWMHLIRFREVKNCFLRYGCDLTRAFKAFQDQGYVEISTCAATHGFLPFYTMTHKGLKAQIEVAVGDYQATFGRSPNGIWLPECAYTPGIERYLEEAGLKYFFVETHAVLKGDCPSAFATHAPVYIKGSNVACFPRDPETGKQVWSGDEGYPGDPDYLEFHIKGGPLKYNRITSRGSDHKEPYVRQWAMEKAARHAQHFMEARNFRFSYIQNWFWKKPLVVAMYDAELFGHHWYEGPDFLYYLLKKFYYDQNETELITPSGYLARYLRNQDMHITPSSWGDKGTFDKWMYGSVAWMYRHVHDALREFEAMAHDLRRMEEGLIPRETLELKGRIFRQATREVLQAMNSDIAFVISNGHFVDRMKEFFFDSLERFWILYSTYWNLEDEVDLEARLLRLELENPIFPALK